MARFGLAPIGIFSVDPVSLLYQRPVKCEMIPVRDAAPLEFLDSYFSIEDGGLDYNILNSMQYKLICAHSRGELDIYSETDYWRWHVALRQEGINADIRTDAWIAGKIEKMLTVFESIRSRGYDYSRFRHYPWVVRQPLIHSRYGYNYLPDSYEILDGHHRVAAAACLGLKKIFILLFRDVAVQTPFGIPLSDVVLSK